MSGEGVTERQLYEALRSLESVLGGKIDAASARLERKLDEHAEDDKAVANRVLVIETQRADERAAAVRRGTWAGIAAAAGVTSAWQALQHWWK